MEYISLTTLFSYTHRLFRFRFLVSYLFVEMLDSLPPSPSANRDAVHQSVYRPRLSTRRPQSSSKVIIDIGVVIRPGLRLW